MPMPPRFPGQPNSPLSGLLAPLFQDPNAVSPMSQFLNGGMLPPPQQAPAPSGGGLFGSPGGMDDPLTLALLQAGAGMIGSGSLGQGLSQGLQGFAGGLMQGGQLQRQKKRGEQEDRAWQLQERELQKDQARQAKVAEIQAKVARGEPLTAGDEFTLDPQAFVDARRPKPKEDFTLGNVRYTYGPDGKAVPIAQGPSEPREAPETWRPISPQEATDRGFASPAGIEISTRGQTRQGAGYLAPDKGISRGDQLTLQNTMRTQYRSDPVVTRWTTVAPVLKGAFESAGRDNRASDLSLTYAFAKVMDPESVVREGEQIMVTNTASLPDWLQGQIGRLNGGATLTPETRQNLIQELQTRSKQFYAEAAEQDAWHRANALDTGLDPIRIAPDLPGLPELPNLTRSPPAAGPVGPALPMRNAQAAGPQQPNVFDGVPGAAQPPPPVEQRQAGQTYNTPRGPMTWTGTGWVPGAVR